MPLRLAVVLLFLSPLMWAGQSLEFMVPSGEYIAFVNEVIKPEFERRYPDTGLIVTSNEQLDTRLAAGDSPHVYAGPVGGQVALYARLGKLSPLNQHPGFDALKARISPGFLRKNFGRNFYIPWHGNTQMMIYNKKLFAEAGLDPDRPPETWDEFLSVAKRIHSLPQRKGGQPVYGTVFWNERLSAGSWYWNMLSHIYYNFNDGSHQLLNRFGTHPVFDRPGAGMAEFFSVMRQAQEFAPLTMEQNFFSGNIGMWLQYSPVWNSSLLHAAGGAMVVGEDVGIAPIPVRKAGGTHYSNLGGRALMVFKSTPKIKQRSWQLIELLMEDRYNLEACKALGQLPNLTRLQKDGYFQTAGMAPFIAQLAYALPHEPFVHTSAVANIVLKYYSLSVLRHELPPEQAVKMAAREARGHLSR